MIYSCALSAMGLAIHFTSKMKELSMYVLDAQQGTATLKIQSELGRNAELDYAESMLFSSAGLNNGAESTSFVSAPTTPDAYTMQLNAILAQHVAA